MHCVSHYGKCTSRKTGNSDLQTFVHTFLCSHVLYKIAYRMFHITEKPTRFVRADKLSTVLEWTKGINNNKTSVGLALDCKKKRRKKKKKHIHTLIPLRPAARTGFSSWKAQVYLELKLIRILAPGQRT